MTQRKFPAVFMRGGTSKAIIFHKRDLPAERAEWDAIFLSAMGSPDPHGRQLDGMGGGISSLSKVCVIAPSQREDADIDYTFAQVQVKEARVDYGANCGNMSSAVGPFAVEEGLVPAADGDATVRIFNTNTRKIIHSTFGVRAGRAVVEGTFAIPGVAGTGAPIRLDFIDPGGATTGRLLPSGHALDVLDIPGIGRIEVSMVDAANACAFVAAAALGLKGTEMPDELERNAAALEKLAAIRLHASVAMGIARTLDQARARTAVPFIGFVSPAQDALTLSGERLAATAADLTIRMISNGQPHRALPLTASLCAAVAARIEGSVVWKASRRDAGDTLRLAMPSGVLTLGAEVRQGKAGWQAARGSFYRTARRLFEGYVYA
ncbi:MAG TPA: PrpF domain-containing protein [Burkholderiales bacterium]